MLGWRFFSALSLGSGYVVVSKKSKARQSKCSLQFKARVKLWISFSLISSVFATSTNWHLRRRKSLSRLAYPRLHAFRRPRPPVTLTPNASLLAPRAWVTAGAAVMAAAVAEKSPWPRFPGRRESAGGWRNSSAGSRIFCADSQRTDTSARRS